MPLSPTIRQYMTPTPKSIAYDQSLADAKEYMRKLHVRHLPVVKGGKIVGIVSDRDIDLILTFQDVDALNAKVESVLVRDPAFIVPETAIEDGARLLLDGRFGCVLVIENTKLVGIFTVNNALEAFADLFDGLAVQPHPA